MTPAGVERPPFEPGNTIGQRHGAYSPAAIAERAQAVHAELLTFAPYLDEPRFMPAIERYLHAASREALLDEHIRTLSAEKDAGAVPARVWEQCTAAARLAAKLGDDLGLSPIGHARIQALSAGAAASGAAASLAELSAAGKAARLAAGAADAESTAEDEGEADHG